MGRTPAARRNLTAATLTAHSRTPLLRTSGQMYPRPMSRPETRIEMERRHLREAQTHVAKQRALVARLRQDDLPTDMARDLLAQFEGSLVDHRAGLARLIEEQRLGLRDVDGNLLPGR